MVAIPLIQWVPLSQYDGYPPHTMGTFITRWWLSPSYNGYLYHKMMAFPLTQWVSLSQDDGYPPHTMGTSITR